MSRHFLKALLLITPVIVMVALCFSQLGASARARTTGSTQLLYVHTAGKTSAIVTSNCDGSKPREIVRNGSDPLISRDGRWVSFLRFNDTTETYASLVFDLRESKTRRVSRFGTGIMWTSDSRLLAVTSKGAYSTIDSVVLFNPLTGDSTPLLTGVITYPMLTPTVRALVYLNGKTQNVEEYTFATKKIRVLTHDGDNRFVLVGARYYAITRAVTKGSPTTTIVIIKPSGTVYGTVKLQKNVLIAGGAEPLLWYENGNRLMIGLKSDTGGYAALAWVKPPDPRYRVIYRARAPYMIGSAAVYRDNRFIVFEERAEDRPPRVVIASADGKHTLKVIPNAEAPALNCITVN